METSFIQVTLAQRNRGRATQGALFKKRALQTGQDFDNFGQRPLDSVCFHFQTVTILSTRNGMSMLVFPLEVAYWF